MQPLSPAGSSIPDEQKSRSPPNRVRLPTARVKLERKSESPEAYLNISPLDLSSQEYLSKAGMYGHPSRPPTVYPEQPTPVMRQNRSTTPQTSYSTGSLIDTVALQRATRCSVAPYVDLNSQYARKHELTLDDCDYMGLGGTSTGSVQGGQSEMGLDSGINAGERRHACPYCQRAFASSATLFKHMRNDSCGTDSADNGGKPRVRTRTAIENRLDSMNHISIAPVRTSMTAAHLNMTQLYSGYLREERRQLSSDYDTVVVKTEPGLEENELKETLESRKVVEEDSVSQNSLFERMSRSGDLGDKEPGSRRKQRKTALRRLPVRLSTETEIKQQSSCNIKKRMINKHVKSGKVTKYNPRDLKVKIKLNKKNAVVEARRLFRCCGKLRCLGGYKCKVEQARNVTFRAMKKKRDQAKRRKSRVTRLSVKSTHRNAHKTKCMKKSNTKTKK